MVESDKGNYDSKTIIANMYDYYVPVTILSALDRSFLDMSDGYTGSHYIIVFF